MAFNGLVLGLAEKKYENVVTILRSLFVLKNFQNVHILSLEI